MNRLLGMTAAIGLATAAMPAAAITWGAPDGEDHPNVVALLFVQNGIGLFSCSGKLPSLRKFGDVRMARVKPGSRQARVVG